MLRRSIPVNKKPPRFGTILWLVLVLFFVTLATNLVSSGHYVGFNEYGFSSLVARIGLLLLLAVSAYPRATTATIRTVTVLGLVFMCIYAIGLLAVWGIWRVAPELYNRVPYWMLLSIWFILVMGVLIGAVRSGPLIARGPTKLHGLRFAALLPLSMLLIPDQPMIYGTSTQWTRFDLWSLLQSYIRSDFEKDSSDDLGRREDWEKVIYGQQDLIKQQLAGIKPSSPDRQQIFFIAMAPYSGQSVFAKEVLSSREIMDNHFGTKGRSVILQNNRETVNRIALASNTSLFQMALGLKAKSNPEKDILVLFVTSHGSKDYISVDDYPVDLNPITPATLRAALNASGIQDRVIILSACYAGSFIDDLRDEHTAILAAARDDRTSFGCSNDREWTYFGDALFNHAFRETRSLSKAFDAAKQLIETWETEKKIEHSEPQLFLGSAVEKHWNEIMPYLDQSVSAPMKSVQ